MANSTTPYADQSYQNGDRPAGGGLTLFREGTFDTLTNGNSAADSGDGFLSVVSSGATTGLVSNTRAQTGANSAAFTIALAGESWGATDGFSIGQDGGDSTLTDGQEFWCQFYAFHPTGWDNNTGDGGCKFFRWRIMTSGEVPQVSTTMQLMGGTTITGLRTENEGQAFEDVDITNALYGGFALNQWNKFEFYIRIASGTNGIIRSWCNDLLAGEVINTNTLGNIATVRDVNLEYLNFWNNGSPVQQTMWIDSLKVARSTVDTPTNQDAAGNFFIGDDS